MAAASWRRWWIPKVASRAPGPNWPTPWRSDRGHRATLLIAKLDRLARNVHFISGLMETGVPFVAADMPTALRSCCTFTRPQQQRCCSRRRDPAYHPVWRRHDHRRGANAAPGIPDARPGSLAEPDALP
jgi:hypothetical protein